VEQAALLVVFGGGISIKQRERLQTLAGSNNIDMSNLAEDAGIYGAFPLLRKNLTLI
jgi:hypothetical protein